MSNRLYYALPDVNCKFGINKLKEVIFKPGEIKLLIGSQEYGHIKPIHFPVEHEINLYYDNYIIEDYRALIDYDTNDKFLRVLSNLAEWKLALENISTIKESKSFVLCDVKFNLCAIYIDNKSYLYNEAIKYLTTKKL